MRRSRASISATNNARTGRSGRVTRNRRSLPEDQTGSSCLCSATRNFSFLLRDSDGNGLILSL